MLVHDLSLLGRIALAAALGFAVGWEREVRGHPAGARTFALVASGAAGFTTLAVDAFPATADRLIAGIVTGVGFMGAGVVLRDPAGHVRGLTTAAAIWAIAAVGVIAGTARFVLATMVAALFLLALELPAIPRLKLLDPARWAERFAHDGDPPDPDEPNQSRSRSSGKFSL
jgi:putative Mg2+ transporter-C (MgtC) family protein